MRRAFAYLDRRIDARIAADHEQVAEKMTAAMRKMSPARSSGIDELNSNALPPSSERTALRSSALRRPISAQIADGAVVMVRLYPAKPSQGFEGGRAALSWDEARLLRDELTAALKLDDLRKMQAEVTRSIESLERAGCQ